jgi:O-glycosyl hydrolase
MQFIAVLSVVLLSVYLTIAQSKDLTSPVKTIGGNVKITVDAGIKHQIIEGFGATVTTSKRGLAFQILNEPNSDNIPPELRAKTYKAIGDVGLTMGNLQLTLLQLEQGKFDYSEIDFMWKSVVKPLEQHGFDNYSPAFTIDFRGMAWLAPLRTANYNAYLDACANHVLKGVSRWTQVSGKQPKTLMLFNEPLSGNTELRGGSFKEIVDIIKRTGSVLRANNFSAKFLIPNEGSEEGSLNITEAVMNDSDARQFVAAIGYHPYPYESVYVDGARVLATSGAGNPVADRINIRTQLKNLGKQYNVPLWMTEVSNSTLQRDSIDQLRARAIHIHDELIYADASAYFGMHAFYDRKSHAEHFNGRETAVGGNFDNDEHQVVAPDQRTNQVIITGVGYAIGHYARFVKRGAVRVEVVSSDKLVQVTAFQNGAKYSFVVLNNSTEAKKITLEVKNAALPQVIKGETSFGNQRWATVKNITDKTSRSFSVILEPNSVTSISAE